ncbi:MAG: LysR family transcriptional regulator [Kiritimatiellia bacterium]
MPSIQQYFYALALARTGSFKHAALELHVSQPALSKAIHGLENEFGMPLFDRGSRPVEPTAAGRLVLKEAARLLRGQEDLKQQLLELKSRSGGRLAIAWGPYAYARYAIPFAREFSREFPDMDLAYSLVGWDQGPGLLNRGEVDLVVADITHLMGEDYVIEPLSPSVVRLICAPDHPLAMQDMVDLPSVFQHRMAVCGAPPWARSWLREHMPDFDTRDTPAQLVCNDYFLIRELVLKGEVCTLMASEVFAGELARGELVALDLPGAPTTKAGVIREKTPDKRAELEHALVLLRSFEKTGAPNLVAG